MQYSIKLNILNTQFLDASIDGSMEVKELITYLEGEFPQLVQNFGKKIVITSTSLKRQLSPARTISEILVNQTYDTFDVELNQQSQILQQSYSQQDQTEIVIYFQFQDQEEVILEFDVNTTLSQLQTITFKELGIKKNSVCMIWNQLNLNNIDQNYNLLELGIESQSIIKLQNQLKLTCHKKNADNFKIKFKVEKNNQVMVFKFLHSSTVQELIKYLFEEFHTFLENFQAESYELFSQKENKFLNPFQTLQSQCYHDFDKLFLQEVLYEQQFI